MPWTTPWWLDRKRWTDEEWERIQEWLARARAEFAVTPPTSEDMRRFKEGLPPLKEGLPPPPERELPEP